MILAVTNHACQRSPKVGETRSAQFGRSPVEQTDESLMAAVAAGDRLAFERLYARHKTSVLNFFLRTTGRHDLAEELFQELFLRVFGAGARYEPRRPFRVWLYTLARNLLRDRWRRFGRMPDWEDTEVEDVDSVPDTETSDARREEIDRLRGAVLRLPPALREVLILSRYHGLSFAEIAEIVACTEAAARVRAFRALERLRVVLGQAPAEAPMRRMAKS